jgi:hypothetical protein
MRTRIFSAGIAICDTRRLCLLILVGSSNTEYVGFQESEALLLCTEKEKDVVWVEREREILLTS